jgi:hypothetical protein
MENFNFKKADIWADIEFVPSDPNRESISETTKIQKPESKIKRIGFHLKEIIKLISKV